MKKVYNKPRGLSIYIYIHLFHRQNDTKPGLAVHFTLDFDENKATNDGNRIRNIILKKSGRYESEDTLYLLIRKFLVYLRSLRVELEVMPKTDDDSVYRPRIPWSKYAISFALMKITQAPLRQRRSISHMRTVQIQWKNAERLSIHN